MHKLKIIPVREASIKNGFIPKYSFHIWDTFKKKFVKQDQEMIYKLNKYLDKIDFDL